MPDTNEEKRRGKGVKMTGIATGIVAGIACAALLAFCVQHRAGIRDWMLISDDSRESAGEEDDLKTDKLHSDFFCWVAEIIWEKDMSDISEAEYASLTSLQIDRTQGIVCYQLNHGQVRTFACPETLEKGGETETDFSDLQAFAGLAWISVDGRLEAGDLQGLEDLFGIHSKNTAGEMADIIPDLEKITELGIEGQAAQNSLEGIEAFPNLRYLFVECRGIKDISVLEKAADLQGLILEECGDLRDYGSLLCLKDLEWLKISGGRLESIDFLKELPRLSSLSLEDMTIDDSVEEIFGIPTLRQLYLNSCRMKLDFDRVPDNAALEILAMNGCRIMENPAGGDEISLAGHCDIFARFPNLAELYLASAGLESIEFVEGLPRLRYLDITGNPVTDLTPLEQLSEFQGVRCGEMENWEDFFLF